MPRRVGRRSVLGLPVAALLAAAVFASPARSAGGDLDPTFGTGGRVVTDFGFDDRATGVALQPDGRIVVAGTGCGGDFLVARYDTGGAPDPSFGLGGGECVDVAGGLADEGRQVMVLGDGRLLVAGTSGTDFALVRLNADGSPDATFGVDGRATYDFGGADHLQDAALAPDGKVVMVGETSVPGCATAPVSPGQTVGVAVARTTPDGALDPSFGAGGRVVRSSDSEVQRGLAVAVEGDGAVVVAGRTASCTRVNIDPLVFRLTPAGGPDPTFDAAAVPAAGFPSSAADVVVQPDAKVVVAVDTFVGPATSPAHDDALTVVRYNPDGSADAGFDGDGVAVALFGDGKNATATSVALQGDKVVVGGTLDGDFALARFDADGSPDPTFGTDSKVVTDLGGADALAALAVQPDGRLVAAGWSGTDVALARYGSATPASTSSSTPTSTTSSTTSTSSSTTSLPTSTTSLPTTTTTTTTTTTATTSPSPFEPVCATLRDLRSLFAGDPFLRPFTAILDQVGAAFGCSVT